MKIQKFLHSCILLEKNGTRLLIDPGNYCFIEKKLVPEDLGAVDVILITHEHQDHVDSSALLKILERKKAKIYCTAGTQRILNEAGIESELVTPGKIKEIADFRIEIIDIKHDGPLVGPMPENVGFLINEIFFHPGDSIAFPKNLSCKILAMPVAGPWIKLHEALDAAIKLHPEYAIPIHDAIIKDFSLEGAYERSKKLLADSGIAFHPLKLGEILEI